VKIAAPVGVVVALVCAVGLAAPAAGSRAVSVSRNMVVVSTTDDAVNGNTSSVVALNRKPGRDGISLREALLAADRTGGSATVYILFSSRLNGKTIEIRSELPPIHRDHLVLEGIAPNGSPAKVTLDGSRAPLRKLGELLLVQASNVTIRWLRFTGVNPKRNPTHIEPAVNVRAGRVIDLAFSPFHPRQVANVQIVDNVFDNSGVPLPPPPSLIPNGTNLTGDDGVIVGALPGAGANTQVSGITIARNAFLHYSGNSDGVAVLTAAPGATAQGVVIEDNTFDQNQNAIELGIRFTAHQTGAQIIGNTIRGGTLGIIVDTGVDGTLVEDNTISGTQGAAISPSGQDTQIVNNVIGADFTGLAGIDITGGSTTIENDTLVNKQPGTLLSALPAAPGTPPTNVTIRNSILYDPPGWQPIAEPNTSPYPVHLPDVVTNSLISGPDWAGRNGNINGDPLFVNAPGGDYHLTAGSPAVNAGTTIGAPSNDLDGAPRDAQPDIGAFEFGATPRPLLTVTSEQLGGSGTVTSSPAGINCGTTCDARFDPSTTVTLTARPDRGSQFLGWGQPCSDKARCTISLTSATSVTARFGP
jgi:Right handed beta helix region/Divergent InlB B-repeat domain